MALTTIPSELSSVSGISDSSTSTAITINSSQEVTFAGNITTGSNTISGVLASATTATTQAASDNSTKLATTAYVTTALANLVDSAPGTLNTLNELAAALGDDANFSTTVTNSIATKLPLAGGTMTGALNMGSQNITNAGTLNGITTTQSVSGTRWGVLPEIAANGVMEIGRYVDFHATSGDTSDYGARFDFDGSKMILTSDFEGSGTIRGTRLGGNADPNSNYGINTLQNGSMTHAGYFQVNGDDIGIEINATAGSYSSSALLVKQSSVASGGNLVRVQNSSGDKFVITTAGDATLTGPSSATFNLRAPTDNAFMTIAGGYSDSGAEEAGIILQQNTTAKWQIANTTGNDFRIYNYAGSAAALTIDSSGNVGIGSSPNQRFHIKNTGAHTTMRIENDNADFLIQAGDAGDDGLHFYDNANGAYRMTIDNAGHVGIGTTTPAGPLHIQSSANTIQYIHAGTNSSASLRLLNDAHHWDVNCQTNDKFAIYSQTDSVERLVILPTSGNVGIGTANPDAKLDVQKATSGSEKLARFVNTGSGVDGITVGTTNANSSGRGIHIGHNNSGGTGYIQSYNYGSGAWDSTEIRGANVNIKDSSNNTMFRVIPNAFSFGGGTTSHGRIRQYHYAAVLGANTTVALLQNNSGAHTDVNFIYWIEAYHSGRTYRTGVGTFGGYGLYTQSAGTGLNFTITAVSTGIKRLDFAAAGVSTTVYIGMLILGDTGLTVHNGTLGDQI